MLCAVISGTLELLQILEVIRILRKLKDVFDKKKATDQQEGK